MEIKNPNKIISNKHNNKANNNHKIKIVFNKKKRKNQKSQKNNWQKLLAFFGKIKETNISNYKSTKML